jgi:hypothetical protein
LIGKMTKSDNRTEPELHNQSFGISSDPLTQFAMIFACLIHDVGHIGVPNDQLEKEEADIALRYKNQSIAEQNSIAIGWQLLMEPRYEYLRSCIYKTNVERKRFRQVLINSVMATDLLDLNCHQKRVERWDMTFKEYDEDYGNRELLDRKATVVIENLIQMADVAHTMQHWHTYRRWNDRLFEEMVNAYRIGRTSSNPAVKWYKGELDFFDSTVIPLAKRIRKAGVFGVGGAELYVSHAKENRNEWKQIGRTTLAELKEGLNAVDTVLEEEDSESSLASS